jgi:transmembrane sensor
VTGSPADLSRVQDDIDAAASVWFAKRRMLAPDQFDETGFHAWLDADPRHEAAYAAMCAAAAFVGELGDVRASSETPRRLRPSSMGWTAAGLAAAAAAAALFAFGVLDQPDARYATAIAEIETVTLSDGSAVTLGPASRVDVRFSQRERRVSLATGQAFFEVEHDAGRPFFVDVGDATVRVIGTKFDVRRGGEAVRVSVAEGVVRVHTASPIPLSSPAAAVLRAGDQAEAAEHAPLFEPPQRPAVSRAPPASAGAWRQGHLAYVEAPLSELVADLNRYYAPGVRLTDPDIGTFKLTASFPASDLDTFFSTLPAAAPVSVTRGADGEIVIGPAG